MRLSSVSVAATWIVVTLSLACIAPSVKASGGNSGDDARAEFFESRVRPLLLNKCAPCHGANQQQGGLRLDNLEGLNKGGKGGPVVAAGKPEASRLIEAVSYTHPTLKMPPAGKMDSAQIDALTEWVKQGAYWPPSGKSASDDKPLWSVQPIRFLVPPRVRNAAWVKNPIDAFVLSTLEKKGMAPAPPIGRRELLRRVYFDVIGLPPSPREVADFLADRSPNAYEKVVDRLLASPRYGERWARYWLDLVRYADTNGYERDAEKTYSWKYRDYVIRSLNEDKPYDRFVMEQLAGDELPDRNETTYAATGFLRLGTWDDEPNDPLQYKYERLDDLVHATSTAFLGLTVRCARCHDHKFDPIPQKDYYAFANAFYAGYLDPGPREHMGGPPPDRLKYSVLAFTDRSRQAPALHLLVNGDPTREAEIVPPGYLSLLPRIQRTVLPPEPKADTTGQRLQLARWILDPQNPLTARVMVNRIWQNHFGQGLVRTPNNFGRKGSPPTHPELLDWLATAFMSGLPSPSGRGAGGEGTSTGAASKYPSVAGGEGGNYSANGGGGYHLSGAWSIKRVHRLILLSDTYRMSSIHPLEAKYSQVDSGNELLWKYNLRRLDADALRDSVLAVSGKLNFKERGPGFVPTVTREALEGLSRKGAEWQPSAPEEQNRRTIYMFLKRALINPLLTIFDFADTTQPLEQRDVSLVAPQALALLNNPFLQEQSEAFARRVETQCGKDRRKQVEQAWQDALGRPPSTAEVTAALSHMGQIDARSKERVRLAKAYAPVAPPYAKAVMLLRADQGVETDSGGRVLKWTDAAGKHLASQSVEGARPVLVRDALNGKPALRFDGKGRFLAIEGQALHSQQFSIVAVANDRATDGKYREIFSNWNSKGNVAPAVFFGLAGTSNVRLTDFFAPAGTVSNPSETFLLTGINSGVDSRVYQNRTEIARVANPLPARNLDFPYVIGQQGNINGEFWNGDILEVQVYDHALSDAEREAIWDDLTRRYGIAKRPVPADPALVSLCHVLFNASEFLYVD